MNSQWGLLAERYHLSQHMMQQMIHYVTMLQQAAQQYNLTAIVEESDIIEYHIADSLELGNCIDMQKVNMLVDVGSGAGFPGLPLKIAYSTCTVLLLEVLAKRRVFLQQVVDALLLASVMIDERDWRTFLRTSQEQVQVICARASLKPSELLRMFQPSSPYRSAQLVYWASEQWQPTVQEEKYIQKIHEYTVGNRTRKLVVFSAG